jgi:hypothetical protein
MKKSEKERIGQLIGSLCCWQDSVTSGIHKEKPYEDIRNCMKWYNDAGEELNKILGYDAVILYKDYNSGRRI